MGMKITGVVLLLSFWISLCSCDDGESTTDSASLASTESSKKDEGEFWLVNLCWNILGYATIVLPCAIVIRMVKNSNFKERGGSVLIFLCIYIFINIYLCRQ